MWYMNNKPKHPYQLIQYRYDIVVRIPKWVERDIPGSLYKGMVVKRIAHDTIEAGNGRLIVGESYTKFSHYA